MTYAVFSDLHGNLNSLERFVRAVERLPKPLAVLGLGDLAGSHSTSSMGRIFELLNLLPDLQMICGNSDPGLGFPSGPRKCSPGLYLCHGSPYDPAEYMLEAPQFSRAFNYLKAQDASVLFFGHTHIPACVALDPVTKSMEVLRVRFGTDAIRLNRDFCFLFNPGSLGKPRQSPAVKSFLVFDSDDFSVRWQKL